ncbi:CpsB/CapC family capsule biosynthesis tyrosine phosphatase [Ruminococcus flavefaciens]|uniref:CpsB/CapC family capsule biosynthesis tyrosine phosphatase n=1 Tax=Ruminococcus flavefaciens TaxID=1265 RepID=UPI0002FD3047|nr:CpsB/CapC family capsule biosynthesis tyrosine phosphatase [Ruminococcus flavefaciens]
MLTDHHCHVLPGLDDGSDSVETSLAMLGLMKEQGVERVVFTPHFYAHREKSVESFLEKRQAAFEAVKERSPVKNMLLGAEVAVEHGVSELDGIEKLVMEGTDLILMELPYRGYEDWMSEEIYNISSEFGLKIIYAHIHRYTEYYSRTQLDRVLDKRAVYQINNEAFGSFSQKRFVKRLMKEGYPLIFGSDAHNMSSRRPNWDLLLKKCSAEFIEKSDNTIDKYIV